MIELNFFQTSISALPGYEKTEATGGVTNFTTSLSSMTDLTSITQQLKVIDSKIIVLILFKFLCIAAFPLGLKVYEIKIITELKVKKETLNTQLKTKQESLSKLQAQIKTYDDIQDKATEFEAKKNFIKRLSESRLIIPRTLDNIQTNIPKSVWLKGIQISTEEKKSTVEIKGEGLTEDSVNFFADSLKDFVDRSSIRLTTRDIKNEENIRVEFTIKANMNTGRGF